MAAELNIETDDWASTEPEQVEQETVEQEEVETEPEIEESETESDEVEQEDGEESEEPESEEEEDDEEEELFFGDEKLDSPASEEEEQETNLVKHLRGEVKERNDELKALREKVAHYESNSQPAQAELKKPDLWEDHDGDEEAYSEALGEYFAKKAEQDSAVKQQEERNKQITARLTERQEAYNERKKTSKIKGYDIAEGKAFESLNENARNIAMFYAESPEKIFAAVGLSESVRDKLSKIQDPVEFAYEMGKIESKMRSAPKVKSKAKSAPKVQGQTGGKRQSADDKKLYSTFSDAQFK